MVDNVAQCICADGSLSDIGMAVFAGTAFIFAVVDMKQRNLVFSN